MDILSLFYPNMRTTIHFIPQIFWCVSFAHVHSPNKGKLDLKVVKCIFVGYFSTEKGYNYYHAPSKKFFVLADVTFSENESYFSAPYLQGENSIKEDKDQDSYLISPVLTNPPTVSGPVFDPVSVPHFYEPESSLLKLTHGNQMTSKVT